MEFGLAASYSQNSQRCVSMSGFSETLIFRISEHQRPLAVSPIPRIMTFRHLVGLIVGIFYQRSDAPRLRFEHVREHRREPRSLPR